MSPRTRICLEWLGCHVLAFAIFAGWAALNSDYRDHALMVLPLLFGLAHNVKLLRPIKQGECLRWDDVAIDTSSNAYRVRREMETLYTR